MADYYSILTTAGRAILTNAVALGETVSLTEMAVGDGNGADVIPNQDMTELVHEVYRAGINALEVDSDTTMRAELVVPTDTGGFYVREVGLFTSDGDLFAVANLPLTYKPVTTEGAGRELKVVLLMEVSNAESGSITLKIDPTVVLASRDYVDGEIDAHASRNDNPHGVTRVQVGLGNLPNAKSDDYDLDDSDYLATSKAVYDAFSALLAQMPGAATATVAGLVELLTDNEATSGTDTSRAATAANIKAVLNVRGLWSNAVLEEGPVDFNTLTSTRVYYVQQNAGNTNAPPMGPAVWYVVLALKATADVIVQIAFPVGGGETPVLYIRRYVTAWKAWETLVTNNGVVESVGTRATAGTWTLTGLVPRRPVFLTFTTDANVNTWCEFNIVEGAANATATTTYFTQVGAYTSGSAGRPGAAIIIPIVETVVIEVATISDNMTLLADQ